MQETQVRSLGQEDPLEKGMAIHFSILPGQRSLGGAEFLGHKELDMILRLSTCVTLVHVHILSLRIQSSSRHLRYKDEKSNFCP